MKYFQKFLAILVLTFTFIPAVPSFGQSETARIAELERRIEQVERRGRSRSSEAASVAAFVCAAFCALWAQQTGRNAWLWFFLGLFFNLITLLVLLYKNARAKANRAMKA